MHSDAWFPDNCHITAYLGDILQSSGNGSNRRKSGRSVFNNAQFFWWLTLVQDELDAVKQ